MRIWEIDALRGVSLGLMLLFHLAVDLADLFGYPLAYRQGLLWLTGRLAAIGFILLAGLSSSLTRTPLRHGAKILAAALAVTAGTWWWDADTYVRFGILHLLGTAMVTAPLLRRLTPGGLAAIAAAAALLPALLPQTSPHFWWLPWGVVPPRFATLDYYPLLPWYGLFAAGHLAGRRLYAHRQSLLPRPRRLGWLLLAGRHTLLIYLLHQPLLVALLGWLHGRW